MCRTQPSHEHSHPGHPQPTDAALSLADDPEDTDRLTVEIEEDIENEVSVNR